MDQTGPTNWRGGQGRINHSGAPCQRSAGPSSFPPLSSPSLPFLPLIGVAGIFSGVHFSSPKKLATFFLVVVTFRPTRNTSKQRGKNLAIDRRALAAPPLP